MVVKRCWVGGEIGGTASSSQNKHTEEMLIVKEKILENTLNYSNNKVHLPWSS